jgi:hypothetical protein
VEWTASPATVAAAQRAAQDPAPPSLNQDAHVKSYLAARRLGRPMSTWLATRFEIPGEPDLAALDAALHAWVLRHETLRSGFRLVGDEVVRFTLDAADVALERGEPGRHTGAQEIRDLLERRFEEHTDPQVWPAFHFLAVVREDGATLYFGCDHVHVDGYSMLFIAAEIRELYTAAVEDRPVGLPRVGSHVEYSRIEREFAAGVDRSDPRIVRWREFVRACDAGAPSFPLELGVPTGEMPRQQALLTELVDARTAAALDSACRAAGGSIYSGLLAAMSIAAYELGGHKVYRAAVPLHTRSSGEWTEALGWYVGPAPVEIPTHCAQDFRDLVGMARRAVGAVRSFPAVPFSRMVQLLGEDFRSTSLEPFSLVSYMDMRVARGAEHWEDWKAAVLGRTYWGDQVYLWLNRGHDGIHVIGRHPETALATANVARFVGHVRQVLTTVAEQGNRVLTRPENDRTLVSAGTTAGIADG